MVFALLHGNSIYETRACDGVTGLHEYANVMGTECLVPETEASTSSVRIASSNFSLRILAAAVILLFFYYAAGVVITMLLSILLAYFLDPAVELLERMHVARTVGAMVMVLLLIAVLVAVGYGLATRGQDFASDWPKYGSVLKQAAGAVEGKIKGIEGKVSEIAPETSPQQAGAEHPEAAIVRTLLFRG